MFILSIYNNIVAGAIMLLIALHLTDARISAVAVFRRDEVELHKYSAVLAAIEPFRLQLGEEVKKSLSPITYALHKLKGTNFEDPENGIRNENKDVDEAYSRYERKIIDVVRLYEMNVQLFNSMSSNISSEPNLRKKVLLQAFYYRAAADLEDHIKPSLPTLPSGSKPIIASTGIVNQSDDAELFKKQSYKDKNSEFLRFCKAIRTIERERIRLRERIQTELGITALPERMCDPDILPVMCKQVQAACQSFPNVVTKVVEFYGLEPATFEKLFDKHNTDPIYRFKVHREIDKIEKLKSD